MSPMTLPQQIMTIALCVAATMLTRFLPFLVFRKKTPPYIAYLGRVLPSAIIGMLVVYCLKDVRPAAPPHGVPELAALACVAGIQAWKRNALISILAGTAMYMALIRLALP